MRSLARPVVVLVGSLFLGFVAVASGQDLSTDAAARLIDLARQARAEQPTSPTDAVYAFNRLTAAEFGDLSPTSLIGSDSLDVYLLTPTAAFRTQLMESLRKLNPLPTRPEPLKGIAVVVTPKRIDAPDVIKIALARGSDLIEPSGSTLALTTMRTAAGLTVQRHSGWVTFPSTAFAPGAEVRVIVIPDAGPNMNFTLAPFQLDALSTGKSTLAKTLVGLTADQVRAQLGRPPRVDGRRWSYGPLRVYFDDKDVVTSVDPERLDLGSLK